MICLGEFLDVYPDILVFSDLPGFVSWCLLLILKNSWPLFLPYHLSLFLYMLGYLMLSLRSWMLCLGKGGFPHFFLCVSVWIFLLNYLQFPTFFPPLGQEIFICVTMFSIFSISI